MERPAEKYLPPRSAIGNPGSITAKGFRVVSTLGLYISSDEDNTNWVKYYGTHPLSSQATFNASQPHGRGCVTYPQAAATCLPYSCITHLAGTFTPVLTER